MGVKVCVCCWILFSISTHCLSLSNNIICVLAFRTITHVTVFWQTDLGLTITLNHISPGGKSLSKSIIGEGGGWCSALVVGGSLVAVSPSGWVLSWGSADSVLASELTGRGRWACTVFGVSSSLWINGGTTSDLTSSLWSVNDTNAQNEERKKWTKTLLM